MTRVALLLSLFATAGCQTPEVTPVGIDDASAPPLDAARVPVDSAPHQAETVADAQQEKDARATPECEGAFLDPGDHTYSLASANGVTYSYTIVVPNTIDTQRKAPLVVVWHGAYSSPEETRALTRIDAVTAAAGMIAVYPKSPDRIWDVDQCCTQFNPEAPRRDELVFAKELIAESKRRVCVDERRIYTSGFSNGGLLSQLLACKMADVFAAAAPAASTLSIRANDCKPSRPVPVLMLNGTADFLVGYDSPGGTGAKNTPTQTFALWAALNRCEGQPGVTLHQGQATCRSYETCARGAQTTLCSIAGMGHCMPGMKSETPWNCLTKIGVPPLGIVLLGTPNDDIDGVETMIEFLARFSLD